MENKKFWLLCGCIGFATMQAQQKPVYLDSTKSIEERVEDALSRMTRAEKVAMTHAQSKFSSAGVPRLGIPDNWTSDGPHGIRAEVYWDEWNMAGWTNDSCTAFPALTCLAATWNPQMAALFGQSIGEEARYRNKNVLLGPGVNIYRVPLNGRNFEYMGEDPYLASQIVVPYVQGVQKNGVASCVKHFALNNQEIDRFGVNVNVDDRALYEIYLPAFKAAVQQGHAWAIMGAYNLYKNQHNCHNQYLLNDILKRDWQFDGVVISDWGGVHDTDQSVYNGLDMEFGTWTDGMTMGATDTYSNYFLANAYLNGLNSGKYSEKELNEKVRRILRLVFRTNMNLNRPFGSFASPEHALASRTIAQEGIVLLKNEKNLLPIDVQKVKKILVVGENAIKSMTTGGGSSSLKVKNEVSPLQGIKNRFANVVEVNFVTGYKSQATKIQDLKGAKDPKKEHIDLDALRQDAVEAAKEADLVIFIGGLNKNKNQDCEGDDRKTMDLPYKQNELIEALAKANPNLVVTILSGNAVSMPWVKSVPAIVESWYLGSEAGNALAAVLSGDVNPSGKLPFTFPVRLEDNGAIALGAYPGKDHQETYSEGIFVGYRWAEAKKIKPLFAFGHGMSYTTFKYGKMTSDKQSLTSDQTITLTVPITNTGNRAGKEIVQLYIRDPKSSLVRPVKELKGFQKLALEPGETKQAVFVVGKDALSYYDDQQHQWVAEPGDFEALVGAASDDIKTKVSFKLK